MRILLINYEFPPIGAGAANATYHIGKSLVNQGHQISILTSSFRNLRGFSIEDKMRIFRCPALRKKASQSNIIEMLSFLLSAFLALPWLLHKQRIDAMLVFFSFPCGPLGLWGKLLFRTPYVVSLRGGDVPGNEASLDLIHKILQPLRRLIYRNSLAIVVNSEGQKALSEKADPFSVKPIPNGVDADFFVPAPKTKRKHSFLFVGRFQRQKNIFFLLEQMELLFKNNKKDFELHLVGQGPSEKSLKRYSKSLGISSKIFWHGWSSKEKLKKYYQESFCLINPSLCEGMPNVVLEAMACGLPVIASNVPGNDSLVQHGETGLLFDLNRAEAFQEAVLHILKDKDLAYSMGQKGKEWIEENFSWDKTADAYIRLFERENRAI